jgi:hypothetical protein
MRRPTLLLQQCINSGAQSCKPTLFVNATFKTSKHRVPASSSTQARILSPSTFDAGAMQGAQMQRNDWECMIYYP